MRTEDFVNTVNRIQADEALKERIMSGQPAKQRSASLSVIKYATYVTAAVLVFFAAVWIPQALKLSSPQTKGSTGNSLPSSFTDNSKVHNFLILGVDDSQKDYSDSILLVSIDNINHKLKMTSFLRDLYVDVPQRGKNKLGAVSALGDVSLTAKTIENNFAISVDYTVIVNYDAFKKTVDELGGVQLTITDAEAKLINANSGESSAKQLRGGDCRLTGKQALYYSRIRSLDSDIVRTQRQRKVLAAVMQQAKSADAGTLNRIANEVLPLIKTNMDKTKVLELLADAPSYLQYPVSQLSLPKEDEFTLQNESINGHMTQVLVPDFGKCRSEILQFIYNARKSLVISTD